MVEYEGMLLMEPELNEEGVEKVKRRFEETVTEGKGESGMWEVWGRRKMAFLIEGRTEAVYVLMSFKGSGKVVKELKKICGVSESILRCMFLRKD